MAEVLSLTFTVSSGLLAIELDAVDPANGGTVIGAPTPRLAMNIEELRASGQKGARVANDLAKLLADLEPIVRKMHKDEVAAVQADPSKLTAKLAELASNREGLAAEREAHRAELASSRETLEKERAAVAAVRAEREALEKEHAAQLVELEALRAAKSEA
jgi:chromosome segregation ATPase